MQKEGAKARRFGDGTEEVVSACIEVHRHLGPGLLESIYERCLCKELTLRAIPFERQRVVRVTYKGEAFDAAHRLDVVVRDSIVVEIKAVERLTDVHHAQVLTYLRLTGLRIALLVNFNVAALRHGLRRVVLRAANP